MSPATVTDGQIQDLPHRGVRDAKTGTPVDGRTDFEAGCLSKRVVAYMTLRLVGWLGLLVLTAVVIRERGLVASSGLR